MTRVILTVCVEPHRARLPQEPIVPYPDTGQRLPGLIKDLQTVVIDGGPHAICETHADQVNSAPFKFMA